MSLLAGKPYQGIATMTYTRCYTRPSQKDLARVVYPLNNKSLDPDPDPAITFCGTFTSFLKIKSHKDVTKQ